jgi:TM2 domain-containing membrane protein YozV/type II secretory pathway pseudopilin PulG
MYCKDCTALKMGITKKEERSPVIAAVLSFVIAGSGQIYNGQVGKGILILLTSWLIIPWIIGIVDAYRVANLINQGKIVAKKRTGCLIAVIASVVIFWITIAFVALIAAIAIPNLLRVRVTANEARAKENIKIVATAIEAYRTANNGAYPLDEAVLVNAEPPYLWQTYNNKTVVGYTFSVPLARDGYTVVATPKACGVTGDTIFTIANDADLSEEECEREVK